VLDGDEIEVDFADQLEETEEIGGAAKSRRSSSSSIVQEVPDAVLCNSSGSSIHELLANESKASLQVVEDFMEQVQLLSRAQTQEVHDRSISSQISSPGIEAADLGAVRSMSLQYSEDFIAAEDGYHVGHDGPVGTAAAIGELASMQYSEYNVLTEQDQQLGSVLGARAGLLAHSIQPLAGGGLGTRSSSSSSSSSSASILDNIDEEIDIEFSDDGLSHGEDDLPAGLDGSAAETAAVLGLAVGTPSIGSGEAVKSVVDASSLAKATDLDIAEYSDDFAASVSHQCSSASVIDGVKVQQSSASGEGAYLVKGSLHTSSSREDVCSSTAESVVSEAGAAADMLLGESSQEWQEMLYMQQQQEEQDQEADPEKEEDGAPVQVQHERLKSDVVVLSKEPSDSELGMVSGESVASSEAAVVHSMAAAVVPADATAALHAPSSEKGIGTDTGMLDAIEAGIDALAAELEECSSMQEVPGHLIGDRDAAFATSPTTSGVDAAAAPVALEGPWKGEAAGDLEQSLPREQSGNELLAGEGVEEKKQEDVVQEQRGRAWSWHGEAEDAESASEASAASSGRGEAWVIEGTNFAQESSESMVVSLGQRSDSISSSSSQKSMESAGDDSAAVAKVIAGRVVEAAVAEALGVAESPVGASTARADGLAESDSEFELDIEEDIVEEEEEGALQKQSLGPIGRWGGAQDSQHPNELHEKVAEEQDDLFLQQEQAQQEPMGDGHAAAAPIRYSAALFNQARQLLLTREDEGEDVGASAASTDAHEVYAAVGEQEEEGMEGEEEEAGMEDERQEGAGCATAEAVAAGGSPTDFREAAIKPWGDEVQEQGVTGVSGERSCSLPAKQLQSGMIGEQEVFGLAIDEAFEALVAEVIQEAVSICSSGTMGHPLAAADMGGSNQRHWQQPVGASLHANADDVAAAGTQAREGEKPVVAEDQSRTTSRSSSRSGSCPPDWLSSPEPAGSSPMPNQQPHHQKQHQQDKEVLPTAVASSMEWPVSHVPDWQLTPLSDYETPKQRVPLKSEAGLPDEGTCEEAGKVDEVQRLLEFEEGDSPDPKPSQQQTTEIEKQCVTAEKVEVGAVTAAAAAADGFTLEPSLSISISQVGDLTEELVVGGESSNSGSSAWVQPASKIQVADTAAARGVEGDGELVLGSANDQAVANGGAPGAEGWFGSSRGKGADEEEFSWDEYEQSMLAVSLGALTWISVITSRCMGLVDGTGLRQCMLFCFMSE
jgi:hypothetical protein